MEGEQPNPQGRDLAQQSPPIESNSDVHKPAGLEKPQLQGTDFGDRNRWNKIVSAVQELKKYDVREQATQILGLPEATNWDEINEYISDQDVLYLARHYGLPEDTPEEVVQAHLERAETERWAINARALGLSENATGSEVDQAERSQRVTQLGLPENSAWDSIWKEEKEQKRKTVFEALNIRGDQRWDWEDVLQRALCLSGSLSTAEDYINRIQEVRKWHIERIVRENKEA